MPITFVITDLDLGGAERALCALATRLDRARWRPTVVCLDAAGVLADTLLDAEIPVYCLSSRRVGPPRAFAKLVRTLAACKPALVQSFLFHANLAARLAAPLIGFPPVLGGIRVAEHARAWHPRLDRLTSWLEVGSICVSEGVLRHTRDVAGRPEANLIVIPNSVDVVAIDRAPITPRGEIGVADDAPVALFIGRLEAQKGWGVLLDAAVRTATARPDWRLVLVGDGPDRAAIENRVRQDPRLAQQVLILGRRGDVAGLLKAADLLVLPSLWEGMPNVVLEAMAAGRAVVATKVEGSEDLVIDGETGRLVPPGDAEALADALLDAHADPERLAAWGRAGRARVEAEFTPRRVVEAYESVWARVLGLDLGSVREPRPSRR